MNTDEPWQALACCMEIAKASRSPDPAAYISHFPVHQVGAQQILMARVRPSGAGKEHPGLQGCNPCSTWLGFLRNGSTMLGILAVELW